jgi:hypothetical protein
VARPYPLQPWTATAIESRAHHSRQVFAFRCLRNLGVKIAPTSLRRLFHFECLILALLSKKMSGRWGDRPLGRGGWRVLQPEASPVLPPVPLRSRAAKRFTGAIRPKPSYSGSPNQLPITVAILPAAHSSVDSPTGSFFPVLPATLPGLNLVPTYLRRTFAASLTLILETRRPRKRRA